MKSYHIPIIISLLICMAISLYIVHESQRVVSKVLENPTQYTPLEDLIKVLKEFVSTLFILIYISIIVVFIISVVLAVLEE